MGPYPSAYKRYPTIRQSRLAAYDACALSAKFDADYRSEWSGHPLARGSIVHRVLADALRIMAETGEKQIPTDVIVGLLAEHLRQDGVDRECPECGGVIVSSENNKITCTHGHVFRAEFANIPMREVKDMRWVLCKWATDNTFDIQDLADIEHRLNATITYPDSQGGHVERTLTGQLDALFMPSPEIAVVLDWKDTWRLPAPTDMDFDGYFQQRMYSWLVLKNYRAVEQVTLREFYVRYSTPREATVYRYELDGIEQELSALAERFDRSAHEGKYPPSPGRHCSFCARPGACPIFPGVRNEGQITDEKTALRVAGEAAVAKSALESREKALKAWSSVRGPVELASEAGRERVWGYVQRQRTKRPSRDDLEKAMFLGKPDLDALYRTETITRFEQHAPVPIEDVADDALLMNALEESLQQQGGPS